MKNSCFNPIFLIIILEFMKNTCKLLSDKNVIRRR